MHRDRQTLPHRHKLSFSSVIPTAVIGFSLAFAPYLNEPNVHAQVPVNGYGSNEDQFILSQPPREFRRALTKSEQALKEKRFADAIEALQSILDLPNSQDYFLPRKKADEAWDSVKRKGQRIIGSMPSAGREAYELEAGSTATRMLQSALQENDIDLITEVSRRFFHTQSGYNATMLLARFELDRGRPSAAAMHLRRLIESPAAIAKYEAELPLMLAIAHQLAGNRTLTEEVVIDHAELLANAKVTMGGQAQNLPRTTEKILAWIEQAAGNGSTIRVRANAEWHLLRGGPDRNSESDGGMPMRSSEWSLPVALWQSDDEHLMDIYEQLIDNSKEDNTAIPTMQPIAVGDWLLFRSVRMMFGVDMSTGKRIWPYPEEEMTELEPLPTQKLTGNPTSTPTMMARSRSDQLAQVMFKDAIYSQISCDGVRAFLLLPTDRPKTFGIQATRRRGIIFEPAKNKLVALDVEKEGMTLWTAGGDTSVDPRLENAFFLGSPLPIDERLYVIAQIKDEIQLLCINSVDGMLLWSQQLAQIESRLSSANSWQRRLAGAIPSFSNGVLVCPTSVGAIVAIEPASRTLMWAYKYGDAPLVRSGRGFQFPLANMQKGVRSGQHWADSAPIISDNCVIFTPAESDKLICLDLSTGKPKWRNQNREQMAYVAGVKNGIIVCMKSNGVRGIKIADGKLAWPDAKFKKGEVVTGRGFMNGDSYYFPTSEAEVVRFDIAQGKIVERQATDRVLGNLVCHRDYLISQSIEGLFAYPIEARKRAKLEKLLKQDSNDADILHDYSILLFEDGKILESIQTMQKAIELGDQNEQRDFELALAGLINQANKENFEVTEELADLFLGMDPPEEIQLEFFKTRARSFLAADDLSNALKNLSLAFNVSLQLDQGLRARPKSVEGDSFWRVSNMTELQLLLEQISDANASSVAIAFSDSVEKDLASDETNRIRFWFQLLANSKNDSDDLQDLFERAALRLSELERKSSPLSAALALASIDDDFGATSESRSAQAAIGLAQLLADQGKYKSAAAQFSSAAGAFAGLTVGNKTVERYNADFRKQMEQKQVDLTPLTLPNGEVRVTRVNEKSARTTRPLRHTRVSLRSTTDPFLARCQLTVDAAAGVLSIKDGFDVEIATYRIGQSGNQQARVIHAHEHHGVIVLGLPSEVVAVDTLTRDRDSPVLWRIGVTTTIKSGANGAITAAQSTLINSKFSGNFSYLGPISRHGVCLLLDGDLECRDLFSGKLKWVQRNQSTSSSTIAFGDDEYAFVNRARSGHQTPGTASVFDLATGRPIATVEMPPRNSLLDTHGRLAIHHVGQINSGTDLALVASDVFTGEEVWKYEMDKLPKVCFVDRDDIAFLQPDGKLKIIRIADGELQLEQDLMPESSLANLFVKKTPDHYFVATNHNDKRLTNNIRMTRSSYMMQGTKVSGWLYAFHRHNGRMAWRDPITVDRWDMHMLSPSTPFVVFCRQFYSPQSGRNRKTTMEFAMLDTRVGQFTVYENFKNNTSFTGTKFDPDSLKFSATVGANVFNLEFTDSPRNPPSKTLPKNLAPPKLPSDTVKPTKALPAKK